MCQCIHSRTHVRVAYTNCIISVSPVSNMCHISVLRKTWVKSYWKGGAWGGARYYINAIGPTPFPHQRKISTEDREHCL